MIISVSPVTNCQMAPEKDVIYFKVLPQHSPGRTVENHEKHVRVLCVW